MNRPRSYEDGQPWALIAFSGQLSGGEGISLVAQILHRLGFHRWARRL